MVTENRKPTSNKLVIVESWTEERTPQLICIDLVERIGSTNHHKIHLSTPELIKFYNELGQTIIDLEVQANIKKRLVCVDLTKGEKK